jgi:hypothetical protein
VTGKRHDYQVIVTCRHHFPRLPRVQENARVPSESGIHMSRSAIASSSW